MELEQAIWLPAACSASALLETIGIARPAAEAPSAAAPSPEAEARSPPEPPPHQPHALYFALIEGIGGEYARQARHLAITPRASGASESYTVLWHALLPWHTVLWHTLLSRALPRQASLSRSSTEQAEWLMACSRLALPRWSRLAREADAMSLDALAMQALAPSLSPRSLDAPRVALALTLALTPSLAMQVHGALHARDNTSDVWRGLDQLAEQARS